MSAMEMSENSDKSVNLSHLFIFLVCDQYFLATVYHCSDFCHDHLKLLIGYKISSDKKLSYCCGSLFFFLQHTQNAALFNAHYC